MDKVKIGIVGSKFAAMLHAESYKRCIYADMQSVSAIDNLDEFADEYKIPNLYEDYHQMLEKEDITLVSVCVPNFLHKDVVIATAEAGKDIICEKPLATSIADAEEMINVCKKNNARCSHNSTPTKFPKNTCVFWDKRNII